MDMKMSGAQTGAIVLTGMVVVFVAILLLIFIIWLMGKIIPKVTKLISDMLNKNDKTTVVETKPLPKPTPTKTILKSEPIQAIASASDDDELIAVISSAVAMMSLADGKNYRVKSVRAIKGNSFSRPAWSMAGLRENTRPFRH